MDHPQRVKYNSIKTYFFCNSKLLQIGSSNPQIFRSGEGPQAIPTAEAKRPNGKRPGWLRLR